MPRDVIQLRTDSDLNRMIDDLATDWGGPLSPASRSAVIREAIRLAHEARITKKTTPGKKSPKSL